MNFSFPFVSHLKACKSIKATFNPWLPGSKSVRQFFHILYGPNLRRTNEKCKLQAEVRSDVVEPQLEVVYNDDSKALFKTQHLTLSDINRVFQRISNIKYVAKETTNN